MESCPREGLVKEKFPNTRKPSHQWSCGEFWSLRGQYNQEEKIETVPLIEQKTEQIPEET